MYLLDVFLFSIHYYKTNASDFQVSVLTFFEFVVEYRHIKNIPEKRERRHEVTDEVERRIYHVTKIRYCGVYLAELYGR